MNDETSEPTETNTSPASSEGGWSAADPEMIDDEPVIRPAVLVFCVVALVVGIGGWYVSGYMPGTLQIGPEGEAWGTGWRTEYYPNGQVQLEEHYVGGLVQKSRWFAPDGELIHEEDWTDGKGKGLVLRPDGSPEVIMEFEGGVQHGQAVYFNRAGRPVKAVMFRAGEPVAEVDLLN
ncbi:MAG: hypothetical protein R3336_05915, partial [Phycisphaeraceae bacterium]|nr:hypothetical protein [Phycisphaeraceae bacterium]